MDAGMDVERAATGLEIGFGVTAIPAIGIITKRGGYNTAPGYVGIIETNSKPERATNSSTRSSEYFPVEALAALPASATNSRRGLTPITQISKEKRIGKHELSLNLVWRWPFRACVNPRLLFGRSLTAPGSDFVSDRWRLYGPMI
jgi:hypothetical protein